jgi:D-beta-D-heptose 7-phosphate kinase / D-beta-D-heptose 1-phosphate adenosyltransferase
MTPGPLVVIGDSLLDQDWTGSVTRLAPDAPVPVVDLDQIWLRPGGAALTAFLAARSGSPVVLLTALGGDQAGRTIERLLADHVEVVALPLAGSTPTKTRVSGSSHPLVRLDRGNGVAAAQPLPPAVRRVISGAGTVVVSDYGRGMSGLPGLADELACSQVPVIWDPHPRGSAVPVGCTLVTPNAAEARALAGSDDPARVRARWGATAVAVTCGQDGARLAVEQGVETIKVPVGLHPIAERPDTCGAGDQLVAAAAETLRQGGTIREAVVHGVAQAARYVAAGAATAVSTREGDLPGVVPVPTNLALPLATLH